MATTDEHARALGMVRLTMDGTGYGVDDFILWAEVGGVRCEYDEFNEHHLARVRLRGDREWHCVRESAAEVLRLLAGAREGTPAAPDDPLCPWCGEPVAGEDDAVRHGDGYAHGRCTRVRARALFDARNGRP